MADRFAPRCLRTFGFRISRSDRFGGHSNQNNAREKPIIRQVYFAWLDFTFSEPLIAVTDPA